MSYADAVRATSHSVDITSMPQPHGGAYGESARFATGGPPNRRFSGLMGRPESLASSGGSLGHTKAITTKSERIPTTYSDGSSRSGGVVGVREMSTWKATRFVVYIGLRLLQMVVAVVCLAFQANARSKRPDGRVGDTEDNTDKATIAVGGITAGTAALSIVLHLVAKTRAKLANTKVAWVTTVFNFCLFATWIVLVLINIVAVDCSTSNDGAWCSSAKTSLATALVSAVLALVVTLRSFSILVRANSVRVWAASA
ncbi:hypothetical protein IWQ56_000987 [Coemansia nantahalensis]|uniref:Uncharacterized protein n=1 Tax=Coemansia nantahalensis TaxID=2789366 RepID=A0ACC1K5T5_9FUNG|nr:hypothetical protein IWQ56_000987 [Coemansia nantahalensis]KAJ2774005.1 hypothetical protein IWQ57_001024 [Coemansia nantahalensis]